MLSPAFRPALQAHEARAELAEMVSADRAEVLKEYYTAWKAKQERQALE